MSYYLYAISMEDGNRPTKIGITDNVPNRLSHLQTANYKILKVSECIEFENQEEAIAAEDVLHKHYSHVHIRGEWFDISGEEFSRDITLAISLKDLLSNSKLHIHAAIKSSFDGETRVLEHFKQHPEDVDLTVRELEKIIGVSKSTVSRARQKWQEQHAS